MNIKDAVAPKKNEISIGFHGIAWIALEIFYLSVAPAPHLTGLGYPTVVERPL